VGRVPGRRRLLLAGLGAGLGLAGAAAERWGPDGGHPPLLHAMAPEVQPTELESVNVRSYGARGDGSSDDTLAIQAAIDALGEGQVLLFPRGHYRISDTLRCRDKSMITIQAAGRPLISSRGGADFTGKALLDLSGSVRAYVTGLRLYSLLDGRWPAAGLVLGRTATSAGHMSFFQNCLIGGRFDVAPVYNAGCEVVVFQNCHFASATGNPSYWDSATDSFDLTGTPGASHSNSRKFFWGCWFANYSGLSDARIVGLHHWQYELAFRDSYFTFGLGGGYVFDLQGNEPNATTRDLVIDNCRVEGGDHANSRLIYVNKTNGLDRLRLSSLVWPIASDYVVEVEQNLSDSDLWLPSRRGGLVKINGGAVMRLNRVYGVLGGKIWVDEGGRASENLMLSSTGFPFAGPGAYTDANTTL